MYHTYPESFTPDPRRADQHHRDDNRGTTSTCNPANPEGFYLSKVVKRSNPARVVILVPSTNVPDDMLPSLAQLPG